MTRAETVAAVNQLRSDAQALLDTLIAASPDGHELAPEIRCYLQLVTTVLDGVAKDTSTVVGLYEPQVPAEPWDWQADLHLLEPAAA